MIYIAVIIFVLVNIGMAAYHSHLMLEGKKIKHFLWGAGYLALAVLLSYLNHSWLLFIDALLIRKSVFDISLNLFNGRHPFFVSTETTSIIDKLHYKVFGKNSEVYYILYLLSSVAIIIFL